MSGSSILITGFDTAHLHSLATLLTAANYQVGLSSGTQNAVTDALVSTPDIIVCERPESDLVHHFKSDKCTRHIPLVLLTDEEPLRAHSSALADITLQFDAQPEEILDAIQKLDTRRRHLIEHTEKKLVERWSHLPHEINTPLNGILGAAQVYLQLLGDGDTLDRETLRDGFGMILRSGRRLSRTAEKYLRYGEIVSGTDRNSENLRLSLIPIQTLMAEVIEVSCDSPDTQNRINLTLEKRDVRAVDFWLIHAVANILENALAYSPKQSPVTILGNCVGKSYELIIEDQGPGIAEPDLKKIAPFTQFNRDVTEQQGLGLGIFNARECLRRCNCQLNLESPHYGGLRAAIIMPLA